jgi:hypothetical protein
MLELTSARRVGLVAWLLATVALPVTAGAQASPVPEPAAPRFQYTAPCESKEAFLDRLAEQSGEQATEASLARIGADISIAEVEPGRWTLTAQRSTAAGRQGRVLRDSSCEQLATAARVIAGVWLQDAADVPLEPTPAPQVAPQPAAAEPAEPPAAADYDDQPEPRRVWGVGLLLESASKLYVAPAGAVTAELWTMRAGTRLSLAGSYWKSFDEWTGAGSKHTIRGFDFTLQLGFFFIRTAEIDVGVTGALSIGSAHSEDRSGLAPVAHEHYFIRPMAAGALLWKFAGGFRLRALFGLTQLQEWSEDDDRTLPSLYAAAGVDYGF